MRVVLAVLFALGSMLGSAGRQPAPAETEQMMAAGAVEDGELIARKSDGVRLARRLASADDPWWAHGLAHARPPQRLDPTVPAPIVPCWQRPRRSLPIDDDGIFVG